jgi:hypothetical protein
MIPRPHKRAEDQFQRRHFHTHKKQWRYSLLLTVNQRLQLFDEMEHAWNRKGAEASSRVQSCSSCSIGPSPPSTTTRWSQCRLTTRMPAYDHGALISRVRARAGAKMCQVSVLSPPVIFCPSLRLLWKNQGRTWSNGDSNRTAWWHMLPHTFRPAAAWANKRNASGGGQLSLGLRKRTCSPCLCLVLQTPFDFALIEPWILWTRTACTCCQHTHESTHAAALPHGVYCLAGGTCCVCVRDLLHQNHTLLGVKSM